MKETGSEYDADGEDPPSTKEPIRVFLARRAIHRAPACYAHKIDRGVLVGDRRLARFWFALETFPELRAAREVWTFIFYKENPFWSQFLQEETFEDDREYVLHINPREKEIFLFTNKTVDFRGFDPFPQLLRLDFRKFAKAVSQAFELSPKFAALGISKTSQIAEMTGLPIVLTFQHSHHDLRRVAAELVSMIGRPFALLAPTRKYVDVNIEEILSRRRAGFFDLESNLKMSPAGQLLTRKSGRDLFSPLLVDQTDPANDTKAARASGATEELHPSVKRNGKPHQKPTKAESLLMGMGDGAAFLGVSRTTLWRMIRDKKLKRVEVLPDSFKVRRGDLEAIAAAQERDSEGWS